MTTCILMAEQWEINRLSYKQLFKEKTGGRWQKHSRVSHKKGMLALETKAISDVAEEKR